MKIERAEVLLTKVPVTRTHKMASGTTSYQENVVLKLFTDEGEVGLGEAPHMVGFSGAGETQQSVASVLKEFLLPQVLGHPPLNIAAFEQRLMRFPQNPRAKGAINMALYDLAGKLLGTPVYNLLGGKCRDGLLLSWSIPIMAFDECAEEARQRVAQGWRVLKVKVGRPDVADDVRAVKTVREAVGPEVRLRVDANQAYDVKTAIRFINAIEGHDIEFMEQPVSRHDLEGLARVSERVTVPIMADEGAENPRDALAIATRRAAEMISIYLTNAGGISGAKTMAAIAETAGIQCYIGGALEGPVGVAACLHFGVSTPAVNLGCEMVGQYLLKADLATKPLAFVDGELLVPDEPGLGVELDQALLDEHLVEAFSVEA